MARIYCNDVAPRDGFQNEKTFIPTEDKVRLIDALSMTGLAKIEATSYVSPRAIPALADAEAVMAQIQRVPGVIYTVLVPNVRGAERALDGKADEFNLVMSASETHNLANLRMTREQSLAALGEVLALARGAGVPVNASLSCCFGCPMEGDVAVDEVLRLSEALLAQGARGITLCDTTGMAYPTQVEQLTRRFIERFPQAEVTLHFHDTRGMALANVLAGVAAGARPLRRLPRRPRRLPVCARSLGQRLPRGHGADARAVRPRHRHRSRRADRLRAAPAGTRRPRRSGPARQGRAAP